MIKRNGIPVVGFGDADLITNPIISRPAIGFVLGSLGGAALGALTKSVGWTAAGTFLGGFGGMVAGAAVALNEARAATTPTPAATPGEWSQWKRIQISDLIGMKAGQQLAMAAVRAGGVPFPPEVIANMDIQLTALATAPANLPIKNIVKYPPGSQLPSDWPKDDDLGPNAYRMIGDLVMNAPPEAATLKPLSSDEGTIELWMRSR